MQTSPVREILSGTLTISRQSGASIQGTIEIVATVLETGETRRMEGSISGSAATAESIDIDAAVGIPVRRHIGSLIADTISGSWIAAGQGGISSSGTFRAERIRD